MTAQPPHPDAPESVRVRDPLAVGLGSLAGGIGFGGACMTASQIVLRLFQDQVEVIGHYALSAGLITAVGVAGACGWYRSYPLDNIWQRGVIAVLAAFGSILVGFLAAPLDRFFGVAGMAVWLVLNIVFGVAGTRWAKKGTRDVETGTGTA